VHLEHGAARSRAAERRDHERAHASGWGEVPVHDVDVNYDVPLIDRVGHLGAEPQEVADRIEGAISTGRVHRPSARSAKSWHQRV